jgi:PAS domain S-box-containing protein
MGMARADISRLWDCEKVWDSGMSEKKPIEEVEGLRSRKAKLERVSRDTTKRRKTEETLQRSKDLYQAVMENTYFGFTLINLNYKIVMANSMVGRYFHKPASELIGRECFREFEKRESVCPHCPGKRVIATGQPAEVETEGVRDDGSRISVRIQAFPTIGLDGNVTGFIELIEDITKREQAEEALRESEERFRQVAENTQEWIWEVDTNGLYTYASPLAEKILGYKLEEIVGKKHFYDLFHPEDRERLKKEAFEAFAKKESFREFINCNVHKDGQTIWLSTSGVPILDDKGNLLGYRGADANITQRKKAEKKLLDYQAQLKSLASELTLTEERERRRIAADLHDQISQSLVISKIKLDTLRSSAPSDDLVKELNEISDSLYQTLQDIRSLTFDLSFPILYELGFEAAAAAWLVEQIQEKYGIKSEFEDDEQPKLLDDDVRVLLFRDVRELLVNVVRHANAKKVKVSIRKVGSEIHVSVEDDGVGFDVAKVVSASAKTGGFGLFSIRERLEELGGHLEIDSEPGHGTRVTLMAPLKRRNVEGRQK